MREHFKKDMDIKYSFSFIEIYRNSIIDLLTKHRKKVLLSAKNIKIVNCDSEIEALKLLFQGEISIYLYLCFIFFFNNSIIQVNPIEMLIKMKHIYLIWQQLFVQFTLGVFQLFYQNRWRNMQRYFYKIFNTFCVTTTWAVGRVVTLIFNCSQL